MTQPTIKPPRVIYLTKGCVAVISAEDFRRVNRHKWRVTQSAGTGRKQGAYYARGNVNGKDVYLHRFIMETPDDLHCDHRNHCSLDCRRENLFNITYKENLARRRLKNVKKNSKRN